jgi:hypothetical protein
MHTKFWSVSLKGNKLLGVYRHGWVDSIKIGLGEIEGVRMWTEFGWYRIH